MTPSRRPQASGDDQFVAGVFQIATWAQKNARGLVLAIVALAVLVGGLFYYLDYQRRVREAASTEIRAIRFALESGQSSQIEDRIGAFLAQFDGSDYAREARMLLAHSMLLQNRAAEAIAPARAAAEGRVGGDVVGTRAAFLLAAAYEEVGDLPSAISVYEEIGDRARLSLNKRRGLEGAARLKDVSGDSPGAAILYDQLVELVPEESPTRMFYEMKLAELQAAAIVVGGT